MIRFAQKFQET